MTLVSSIISDAYRESNMIAIGKAPNTAQVTEALRLYNSVLSAIYGGDAGERLEDWPLGTYDRDPSGDDTQLPYDADNLVNPPLNSRLIVANTAAQTIWLDPRPQDGARMGVADPYSRLSTVPLTIQGNGRTIQGVAFVLLDTDGTFIEWLYRADLADWVRISSVVETDENPFPADFDLMFVILLAMRLNPRYGRMIDQQSMKFFNQNRREFLARYVQSQPLMADDSISWPYLSQQSYDTQGGFSSTRGFNRGDYRG